MALEYSKYNYLFWDNEIQKYLLFNFMTGSLLSLDEDSKALFESILEKEANNEEKELLQKNGFLIDNFDELAYLKYGNKLTTTNSDLLTVLIAPTMECNFDCPYCFEHHGKGYMTQKIQNDIIEFIEKKVVENNTKQLFVYWFGGEPLLALKTIDSMAQKILTIVDRHHLNYSSSMSTNGFLLTPEAVSILEKARLTSLQITLDGIESSHNQTRRLKDGSGSFDIIVSNLKKMNSSIDVLIRCNLNRNNQHELTALKELVNSLNKTTGTHIQLYSAHMSVYEYNNENVDYLELGPSEYSDILKSNNMLTATRNHFAKFVFCDAARKNSFCFDEKGYLYKCWNDIGNIDHSYGHVEEYLNGTLSYLSKYALDYLGYSFPDDKECQDCVVLPICMGGCITKRVFEKKKACIPCKYNIEDYIHKKYMITKGATYYESGN